MRSMRGSAAAPTAGLHFTPELLKEIEDMGVRIAHVTLHVGLGTFRPVKVEDVLEHEMHSEYYVVEPEQAAIMNENEEKTAAASLPSAQQAQEHWNP